MNAVGHHAHMQKVPGNTKPRQRPPIAARHTRPLCTVSAKQQRHRARGHDQVARKQKSTRPGGGVDVLLDREVDAPNHDKRERGGESDSGALVVRCGWDGLHVGTDFR